MRDDKRMPTMLRIQFIFAIHFSLGISIQTMEEEEVNQTDQTLGFVATIGDLILCFGGARKVPHRLVKQKSHNAYF